jgi:hypothetical protein
MVKMGVSQRSPPGRGRLFIAVPGNELPGYFRMSHWDKIVSETFAEVT